MFKVQSLKRTIVVQFAVILVPLVCLLAWQALMNSQRHAELDELFHRHELGLKTRDLYATFVNGAVDAVDTQRLPGRALATLAQAGETLRMLARESGSVEAAGTADGIAAMAEALTADPSLPTLLRWQERMHVGRTAIGRIQVHHDAQLNAAIVRSIAETHRETLVVAVSSLLLLAMTVGFILRMIRDLTRPLAFAVSVADRIAEGRPVADDEFRGRRDIGNLLGSLAGMHANLRRYRAEVEAAQDSRQAQMRQALDSRQSLAEAQQLAKLGNWHWDPGSRTMHWSDELYRILGTEPQGCEPTLTAIAGLYEAQQQAALVDIVDRLLNGAGPFSHEGRIRGFDGRLRVVYHQASAQRDADGRVVRVCGTLQDITLRREAEEKIRRLAHYDSLTGLPNRQYYGDQLERAVAQARRKNEQLATLFMDLDRFKRVNDTLGHAAGDALLKEAARRLRRCVRESDELARSGAEAGESEHGNTVARLGGDEFTATLLDLRHPHDAAKVAQRILQALSLPFVIDGNELVVTASVGIAVFPVDGDDAETLLKNADTAMYGAKEIGKNAYRFFTQDMNSAAFAKLALEADLRRALERRQFVLHYQPKVQAKTGRINSVEALIRWQHPEHGLVAPAQFIPLAEEMGLIVDIGDWVLEGACRQLGEWRDAGLGEVSIAINLSSPSFKQRDLCSRVQAALERHGVEPRLLQLEATESMMMGDVGATMGTLNELRRLGVRLSIDDFGTGYSSLSYLSRFPIDQLKIDRSFVADMTRNAEDAAIVAAIVSLGHTLGLELVAEGVETLRQACLLRELGCETLQGYFFSRPVPPQEVTELLRGAPYSFDRLATRPVPLALA